MEDDKNLTTGRGFFDDLDIGQKDMDLNSTQDEIELPELLDDENSDEPESTAEAEDENTNTKEADAITVSKSKLVLIKKMLANLNETGQKLREVLDGVLPNEDYDDVTISQIGEEDIKINNEEDAKIIEGVFDGEKMIGPDGKQYSVPANYASKSKMVEGDILKLTITDKGSFVYKQIGPIERVRQVGNLEKNGDGKFMVAAEGRKWQILPASVTYFKGEPGDEVVLLIPKAGESKWGAVENIIKSKIE